MMAVEYDCIHEEQIQHQSRKIERLEARADFKEQRIESASDDKELDLRLTAIETELEVQKQASKSNYTKLSAIIAVISVVFVILTFFVK